MKRILLISTGGTIASVETDNGFVPAVSGEELVAAYPEIHHIAEVVCIQLFNLDSTNMRPENWCGIAACIRENYADYDGFVVLHGTDTMAYTAAALSYLVQNSPKPIVLTGAQMPSCVDSSDARRNLLDALLYAADGESCGVQIVFFGSVILGTRARKNYTKSFAAFGSVNYPEIARVCDGRIIRYIRKQINGGPVFYDRLNANVGLVKFTPGMRADVLNYLIRKYDGLLLESFGVGGIPEYSDFYELVREAVGQGKMIVMTTQVPNEGSDLAVYRVGNVVKNALHVPEAYDMTTEAALVKMMWILGQTNDPEQTRALFYTPVAEDILLA